MADFCWRKRGAAGDGSCERLDELAHCRNCAEYARAGRTLFDRPIPEGVREEWARELAAPQQQGAAESLSVFVFRVGGEWFALPTALFQEVAERRGSHTVPGRTNAIFRGLANVNGELLLAFSLSAAAGLPEPENEPAHRRVCVAGRGAERIAFETSEILGVRRVPLAGLNDPPMTVARTPNALAKAVFPCDGRQVALLDEEKLFSRLFGSLA